MTFPQVTDAYIYGAPSNTCMRQADWGNRREWPKGHLGVWWKQALDRDAEDACDAQQVANLRVSRAAFEALHRGSVDAGSLCQTFLCQAFVNPGHADAVAHSSLGFADPLILFC